jgi:hypothetical protein
MVSLVVSVAACGNRGPDLGITGTLVIDGETATPTACKPGYGAAGTYIDIDTTRGSIRFEDKKLSWNGSAVACTRLDRSWGGGHRLDGTAYWRGMLDVDCDHGIRGRLVIDCGNITAEERASLDANRKDLQDNQHPAPK